MHADAVAATPASAPASPRVAPAPPVATPPSVALRTPGRLGITWAPQAAAAAEAATALAERQRIDAVRDERAEMERLMVDAHRDAVRRAAEEEARAEEARVQAEREAHILREAAKQEAARLRARRAMGLRLLAATVLCGVGLWMAQTQGGVGGVLVAAAVTLVVLPDAWLPSPSTWLAIPARTRSMLSKERQWPPQFLCPITGELMVDPVTTSDGHTFERVAIERWLVGHDTSPMTGSKLEHKQLAPAIALRQLIAASQQAEVTS